MTHIFFLYCIYIIYQHTSFIKEIKCVDVCKIKINILYTKKNANRKQLFHIELIKNKITILFFYVEKLK